MFTDVSIMNPDMIVVFYLFEASHDIVYIKPFMASAALEAITIHIVHCTFSSSVNLFSNQQGKQDFMRIIKLLLCI